MRATMATYTRSGVAGDATSRRVTHRARLGALDVGSASGASLLAHGIQVGVVAQGATLGHHRTTRDVDQEIVHLIAHDGADQVASLERVPLGPLGKGPRAERQVADERLACCEGNWHECHTRYVVGLMDADWSGSTVGNDGSALPR